MAPLEPTARVAGIRRALVAVRDVDDLSRLLTDAGQLAVDACGFDRCIVFAVRDGELVTHSVYFGRRSDWAAQILELGRSAEGRQQLRPDLVESEMLRRRMASVVSDAQNDPHTPRALVRATDTRSYVAAPVLCEDRVIAFLHADVHFSDRELGELDRETLAAFATGVGLAADRCVLHRHLLLQQEQVFRLRDRAGTLGSGIFDIDLAIAPEVATAGTTRDIAPRPRASALLTPRQREVLELLLAGASNLDIARRLVITESTAKAHVHRILQLLGAKNRAEAVALWLRDGGEV
ncbi:LuxR C-terminal-related transcriptional regulator [Paraconexibacter algicola]|uniref:HTH luxR-type domain-containing protein n=1 Tax=Paraconexibacter algicola TaxID=2133960 RepID=A0A2T4UK21_9ACTN|nr:LuxR C-terminal-related transcriptional regulator [Paraconexibacter algicola]PTL59565.1 hypothetical protein C7Y72_07840 [Paraconexibacter algicola]